MRESWILEKKISRVSPLHFKSFYARITYMNKNNEGPNLKPEAEKRREEVILNWIRDSLTSDPQFFMKDRYLDV